MTDHRVTGGRACGLALGIAMVLATGGGCAKRQPAPTRPPPPSPTMQRQPMEMDPDRRAADVRQQAESLAALSKNMPGMSPAENRRLEQQAFTQLSQLLPTLGGPDAGGIFEHQVSVVNDTRTQLAGSSPNLATDPIVDNGLRAVRNALTELAHGAYYDQPQIGQAVDQLSAKVDELDTYPGPTHPLAVAAAVQQASATISAMADVLAGRAAAGPTTGPSTEPSGSTAVPATEPSAAPPAAPATEPTAPAATPPATAPAERARSRRAARRRHPPQPKPRPLLEHPHRPLLRPKPRPPPRRRADPGPRTGAAGRSEQVVGRRLFRYSHVVDVTV